MTFLDMSAPENSAFWQEFRTLDSLIMRFTSGLPAISGISNSSPDARDLLVASTLARGAAIQLHTRFVRNEARSRDTCLSFAKAIVSTVQDLRPAIGVMDPIMAVSLPSALNTRRIFTF